MVRVPTSNGPQVDLHPLSGARVESSYFPSMDPVSALTKPVEQMSDAFLRADTLRVDDAVNKATLAKSAIEDEAKLQVGENVLTPKDGKDFVETYSGKFQDAAKDLSTGLANDRQKTMFGQRMGVIGSNLSANLVGHQKKQAYDHALDIGKTTRTSAMDEAKAHVGDSKEMTTQQVRTEATIDTDASLLGLNDDQKKLYRKAVMTDFYGAGVNAALAGDDYEFAKYYLDAHREEMTQDGIAVLDKAVKAKGVVIETDAHVDRIWGAFAPKDDKGAVSLDLMEAEARKITDPVLRKSVIDDLKERSNTHIFSANQRKAENKSELIGDIESGAKWSSIKADPRYMKIDEEEWTPLRKHYEDVHGITRDGDGGNSEAAASEYWRIRNQLLSGGERPTQAQIVAMTPTIGKRYRESLLGLLEDVNSPKKAPKVTIDNDILLTEYTKSKNYPPNRKLTSDDKLVMAELGIAMKQQQEASHVEWSTEETLKQAKRLLKPIVVKRGFFQGSDINIPTFEAIKAVPAGYAQQILKLAPTATPEQIAEQYQNDKANGKVD